MPAVIQSPALQRGSKCSDGEIGSIFTEHRCLLLACEQRGLSSHINMGDVATWMDTLMPFKVNTVSSNKEKKVFVTIQTITCLFFFFFFIYPQPADRKNHSKWSKVSPGCLRTSKREWEPPVPHGRTSAGVKSNWGQAASILSVSDPKTFSPFPHFPFKTGLVPSLKPFCATSTRNQPNKQWATIKSSVILHSIK